MLTDIFATRYADVSLWSEIKESDTRFLTQAFRIISEQIYPYYYDGKEVASSKAKWQLLNDKLSMELGLQELSPKTFGYNSTFNGKPHYQVHFHTLENVCKNFVCIPYDGKNTPDRFMKDRISFIELAFRESDGDLELSRIRMEQDLLNLTQVSNAPKPLGSRSSHAFSILVPGNPADGIRALHKRKEEAHLASVNELNTRLRQAGYSLNYHNGFIQRSVDPLVESHIEEPFWALVSDVIWKNVDTDMKEAIDLRDTGGRDPAFFAARALESTIKIISDQKGWTHGGEKGAQNYIDNLASKKNGQFINDWEKKMLSDFFREVRNPFSHGAGSKDMPSLSSQQTNWAIESCMIWVKNLIRRM